MKTLGLQLQEKDGQAARAAKGNFAAEAIELRGRGGGGLMGLNRNNNIRKMRYEAYGAYGLCI